MQIPVPSLHVPATNVPVATTPAQIPHSMYFQPFTVNSVLDPKNFNIKNHYPLTKVQDTHQWYNRFHSLACVTGNYVAPWDAIIKGNTMGASWDAKYVDPAIMDPARRELMSGNLHLFLSHKDLFTGECESYHMLSATTKDGYELLYQIVRMVHPSLGNAPVQPPQPKHQRNEPWMAYVVRCMQYFQSEIAKGRNYPPNDQMLIIMENIHPIWKDTMKRRYAKLVDQDNIPAKLPSECQLSSIAVTLGHWCHQERLELPHLQKQHTPGSKIYALEDDAQDTDDESIRCL